MSEAYREQGSSLPGYHPGIVATCLQNLDTVCTTGEDLCPCLRSIWVSVLVSQSLIRNNRKESTVSGRNVCVGRVHVSMHI